MRKSKFTESQIVGILSEGEAGLPVAEMSICRKHGISVPTYYQWKSKYSGVSAMSSSACMPSWHERTLPSRICDPESYNAVNQASAVSLQIPLNKMILNA
jgi:transposase-like protein